MYSSQDILVGSIAIGMGIIGLYCAVSNHVGFYELRKIKWLESKFGRGVARWICVVLAIALIALGSAIAVGFNLQRFLVTEQQRAYQVCHM